MCKHIGLSNTWWASLNFPTRPRWKQIGRDGLPGNEYVEIKLVSINHYSHTFYFTPLNENICSVSGSMLWKTKLRQLRIKVISSRIWLRSRSTDTILMWMTFFIAGRRISIKTFCLTETRVSPANLQEPSHRFIIRHLWMPWMIPLKPSWENNKLKPSFDTISLNVWYICNVS